MNIGARIREIRKANGQKLINIAERAGLSQPFISEIERGIKTPSIETLQAICSALEVSLSEFFAEDKTDMEPELRRLIETAKKLTPEQQESVQRLLETMNKEPQQ